MPAHCIPDRYNGEGQRVWLYPSYVCPGSAGVDILAQGTVVMPGSTREELGFCFPSVRMVGVIMQHLEKSRAHAVVIAPNMPRATKRDLGGAECHHAGNECGRGRAVAANAASMSHESAGLMLESDKPNLSCWKLMDVTGFAKTVPRLLKDYNHE